MSTHIRALQARKAAAAKSARDITNAAAAEKRDLTAEESATVDKHIADISDIDKHIEREQALLNVEAGLPRAGGSSVEVGAAKVISVDDNKDKDPKAGFQSFGQFAKAVKAAALNPGAVDDRLRFGAAAPTTFGNESGGADGGFAVPPDFGREIWTWSLGEDSLVPLTDSTETVSNSMVWPHDETTPWGTDGVRAYWTSEGVAGTQTKPKLGSASLRMDKLLALVPMTDELMEDAPALSSYLVGKVGDSIRWKSNEAIFTGNSVGQLMGVMNSPAIIEVAKETGQAAASLDAQNLFKMVSRLPPGSYRRAVWYLNNEVLPKLFGLTLGGYPIYIPMGAGGMQGNPYGMLLGRPVEVSQHCEALGVAGDVQLHDLKYYRTLTKSGGVQTATSMHLFFDADAVAFRATYRMAGGPKPKAPITPAKGATTMSPFVRLGARA